VVCNNCRNFELNFTTYSSIITVVLLIVQIALPIKVNHLSGEVMAMHSDREM